MLVAKLRAPVGQMARVARDLMGHLSADDSEVVGRVLQSVQAKLDSLNSAT